MDCSRLHLLVPGLRLDGFGLRVVLHTGWVTLPFFTTTFLRSTVLRLPAVPHPDYAFTCLRLPLPGSSFGSPRLRFYTHLGCRILQFTRLHARGSTRSCTTVTFTVTYFVGSAVPTRLDCRLRGYTTFTHYAGCGWLPPRTPRLLAFAVIRTVTLPRCLHVIPVTLRFGCVPPATGYYGSFLRCTPCGLQLSPGLRFGCLRSLRFGSRTVYLTLRSILLPRVCTRFLYGCILRTHTRVAVLAGYCHTTVHARCVWLRRGSRFPVCWITACPVLLHFLTTYLPACGLRTVQFPVLPPTWFALPSVTPPCTTTYTARTYVTYYRIHLQVVGFCRTHTPRYTVYTHLPRFCTVYVIHDTRRCCHTTLRYLRFTLRFCRCHVHLRMHCRYGLPHTVYGLPAHARYRSWLRTVPHGCWFFLPLYSLRPPHTTRTPVHRLSPARLPLPTIHYVCRSFRYLLRFARFAVIHARTGSHL